MGAPILHTHRRSTPPAEDDRAGRPGVFHLQRGRLRPKTGRPRRRCQEPGERKRHIHMVALEAPAQKSNSLRQRPQNVALQAAQVLRCLYLQHPYKNAPSPARCLQLHAGEGEIVHDLWVHGLDLAWIGAGSREPSSYILLAEDGAKKRNARSIVKETH